MCMCMCVSVFVYVCDVSPVYCDKIKLRFMEANCAAHAIRVDIECRLAAEA